MKLSEKVSKTNDSYLLKQEFHSRLQALISELATAVTLDQMSSIASLPIISVWIRLLWKYNHDLMVMTTTYFVHWTTLSPTARIMYPYQQEPYKGAVQIICNIIYCTICTRLITDHTHLSGSPAAVVGVVEIIYKNDLHGVLSIFNEIVGILATIPVIAYSTEQSFSEQILRKGMPICLQEVAGCMILC